MDRPARPASPAAAPVPGSCLGLGRGGGERGLGRIGIGQREGIGPVAGPHRQPRTARAAAMPRPARTASACRARAVASAQSSRSIAWRSRPRRPRNAASSTVGQRAERGLGLIVAAGDPAGLRRQQQGRGVSPSSRRARLASRRASPVSPAASASRVRVTAASPARRRRAACRSRSVRGRRIRAPSRRNSGVQHGEQQQQAERHHRGGGLEAEVADFGGDAAGQAGQRPGEGKHHRRRPAARAGRDASAGRSPGGERGPGLQQGTGLGEPSRHRLRRRALQRGDLRHRAGEVAGIQMRRGHAPARRRPDRRPARGRPGGW